MTLSVLITCNGERDHGEPCTAHTPPANDIASARGLALAAGWHLGGGRYNDLCPPCNPRPDRTSDRRLVR